MQAKIFSVLLLPLGIIHAQSTPPAGVSCKSAPVIATDGTRALAAEHYVDAETFYRAQLSTSPSPVAFAGLVDSLIQQDKVLLALDAAKQAVAAIPTSSEAMALLGDAEYRAGLLDEASRDFAAARNLDFCSARAHFGMARMAELSGLNATAQKELIVAHKLAVSNARISEALFATLPPPLHAKGLRNLIASANDIPSAHLQQLKQEAALLEKAMTCDHVAPDGIQKIDLTPLYFNGVSVRDYSLHTTVNGSTIINLELDSTAHGIVLTQTDANRLKVTPADSQFTVAPYLGYVDTLKIGNIAYRNCAVKVVPDALFANRYSVIGTDFFRDFLIDLNWKGPLLTLSPYPAPSGPAPVDASAPAAEKDWTSVYIDGHRILTVSLINKKPGGLFLLDTSRLPAIISPATVSEYMPQRDSTVALTGVAGEIPRIFGKEGGGNLDSTDIVAPDGHLLPLMRPAKSMILRFAGQEFTPQYPFYSFDITPTSHAAGIEVSAILGYAVLSYYYVDIDYRNARIKLQQDVGYSR